MNAALSSSSLAATFAAEIDAEGVLFNMDGVLVCATGGDERCWMRWAEHYKTPLDIRRTHGRRAADTLREHLPGVDDDTIETISRSSTRSRQRNNRASARIYGREGIAQISAAIPVDGRHLRLRIHDAGSAARS